MSLRPRDRRQLAARQSRPAAALAAAAGVCLCLAALVSGCGGSRAPARKPASRPAQTITPKAPEITSRGHAPSRTGLQRDVVSLWNRDAGLHTFVVQDVQYTTGSLQRVMDACSNRKAQASKLTASQALLACAPLIYFFYSYGAEHQVNAAVTLADQIYSYAIGTGQAAAQAAPVLDATLHGWGVPVAAPAIHIPSLSPAVASLVRAVQGAILKAGSVRVVLTGYGPGHHLAEHITSDVGSTTGIESITQGGAGAAIRITPRDAYVSGNLNGLTRLIGLPRKAAARAHGRWIEVASGTTEYSDLATEETIGALPASILPLGVAPVALKHEILAGKRADLLSWRSTVASSAATGAQQQLQESLVLASGGSHLPQSETTRTASNLQQVQFLNWGRPVAVAAPPARSVVAYTALTR